ncbi:MAG: GNAT family N-acetyltransferase [Chloroherpetonaceae bacterium]|nr:GNAT family N-acetyltransferase [Chloroherpetonaceae bacterium]
MKIYSTRLCLSSISIEDAEDIYNEIVFSRIELQPWLPWVTDSFSLEDEKRFIQESNQKMFENESFTFSIRERTTNQLIGTIGTHPIEWGNQSTAIGYWTSSRFTKKGYATESTLLLLEFLICELKLHRVSATAAKKNIPSNRVIEKLGFRVEGELLQAYKVGNSWQDLVSYAILDWEYKGKRKELRETFLVGEAPKIKFEDF